LLGEEEAAGEGGMEGKLIHSMGLRTILIDNARKAEAYVHRLPR
jgi:hypothetical protein